MDTTVKAPSEAIGFYRPGLSSPERLLKTTVGRQEMLEELLGKLERQARKKKKQHFVFIGPRGIGKTHFLKILKESIRSSPSLKDLYTIISFPEESHRILSFADFLLGVVEILGEEAADKAPWQKLHAKLEEVEDDDVIIDAILPRLKQYHQKSERDLLILLENIDTVFSQQLKNEKGMHQLRKFLMESEFATFIGASPVFFSGFNDIKHPMYDFFDIQVLEELSTEQTVQLIRSHLEWDKRHDILESFDSLVPKIMAIHEMTGGNPRLTMMLYDLIAKEDLLEVKMQFEKLLDQISPFYQDRIKELAPQERALLETIALMRCEEKTPAAIARKMRKSQQQCSSLLKRMLEAGYLSVADHAQDKRSKVYRIKEGFFDLWLAMSQSRVQRKYLPHLVEFFEKWYKEKNERDKKRKEIWEKLESTPTAEEKTVKENLTQQMEYLAEIGTTYEKVQNKLEIAVTRLKSGQVKEGKALIRETKDLGIQSPAFIWMTNQAERWSSGSMEPDIIQRIEEMIRCWKFQRSGELEKMASLALQLGSDFSGNGLHELNISFLCGQMDELKDAEQQLPFLQEISYSQKMMGRLDDALETLKQILTIADETKNPELKGVTLNNISQIYHAQGDYETALSYLKQSLAIMQQIGDKAGEGTTLNNIANVYHAQGDYERALSNLKQSLAIRQQIGDKAGEGATLNNISQIYDAQGDYETALSYLKQSLAIMQQIGNKEGEGTTLNNISQIYAAQGDYETALSYLKQSLAISQQIGDKAGEGATLNNIAGIYRAQGDYETALSYLKQSLAIRQQIGDKAGLCVTLFNMGYIHLQNKDPGKALEVWLDVYKTAKAIGLHQALEALKGLAQGKGLESWEELAAKAGNS